MGEHTRPRVFPAAPPRRGYYRPESDRQKRPNSVFSEGAENHTRGRVRSPASHLPTKNAPCGGGQNCDKMAVVF